MKVPAWIRMQIAPARTNDEGLTFDEWLYATHIDTERVRESEWPVFLDAWKNGEDPTEWNKTARRRGWPMKPDLEGS